MSISATIYDYQLLPGEEYVNREQEDDFLGLQNYSRKVYGPNGKVENDENTRLTEMGYEYYPEALAGVVRFVSKYWNKPIMITENGVSTNK